MVWNATIKIEVKVATDHVPFVKFTKNQYERFCWGRTEVYSEPSQTYKMELFVKIVNDSQSSIFAKSSILNVWPGFGCAFGEYFQLSVSMANYRSNQPVDHTYQQKLDFQGMSITR